ncbi:MAG: hypothetical protein ACTSWN_12440, partial [Promethearchaeota archaeon]
KTLAIESSNCVYYEFPVAVPIDDISYIIILKMNSTLSYKFSTMIYHVSFNKDLISEKRNLFFSMAILIPSLLTSLAISLTLIIRVYNKRKYLSKKHFTIKI